MAFLTVFGRLTVMSLVVLSWASFTTCLSAGFLPSDHFNDSITVCPPKKVSADELDAPILRAALDTRPLSLKNTDNKLIAYAINWPMSHLLSERAHSSQNCFVPGRNFRVNVLRANTCARIASLQGSELPSCMSLEVPSRLLAISICLKFSVLL